MERCCLAAAGAVLQHETEGDAPVAAAAVVAAVVAAVAVAAVAVAAVVPVMAAVVPVMAAAVVPVMATSVMAAAVCAAAVVVVMAAVGVLGSAPALPVASGCEAELEAAAQEGREQRSVLGPLEAQGCWLLHVEMVAAPDQPVSMVSICWGHK